MWIEVLEELRTKTLKETLTVLIYKCFHLIQEFLLWDHRLIRLIFRLLIMRLIKLLLNWIHIFVAHFLLFYFLSFEDVNGISFRRWTRLVNLLNIRLLALILFRNRFRIFLIKLISFIVSKLFYILIVFFASAVLFIVLSLLFFLYFFLLLFLQLNGPLNDLVRE